MEITLEQAKAFDAVARCGTIQKAAESLNKGHSAVLYLIRSLELQTSLELFDRTGYRNKVTPNGEIILKHCRELLSVRNNLKEVCAKLKGGWEPSLKLIYDSVIDFNLIATALYSLNETQAPTEIKVLSAILNDVEEKFETEAADLMATILPIKNSHLSSVRLRPIRMFLVSGPSHSLAAIKNRKVQISDLKDHSFIKVTANTRAIGLSTEALDFSSSFLVNDFYTKKQALLRGLGYGWLPDYMIQKEVKSGQLIILPTEIENSHVLKPRIFHRREEVMGKAALLLLKKFRQA